MDDDAASRDAHARRRERDLAVAQFAERFFDGPNRDLLSEMLVTLCRLAHDGASRGDVKLLHKALGELRYAFKVFSPYRNVRKVSVFGSSRTPVGHPDYAVAEEFARRMSGLGWMVITGAGGGIMRAGHGGAGRDASFGVAIRLPFEQATNDIIADDAKLVNFRYFFTRKLMFLKEASAVTLFPGGFGTQDEGFEALTLVQTGKAAMIPIVMCERPGGTYWAHWLRYVRDELLETGMISPEDTALLRITDDLDAAVREVVGFYRVYHSMRWVRDELFIRLNHPLPPAAIERLNDEFASRLLTSGRIETAAAAGEEAGDHAEKPRLRLRFDKRSYGALRRLIDRLNEVGSRDAGPSP